MSRTAWIVAFAPTGIAAAIAYARRSGIWRHALLLSFGHWVTSVGIYYSDVYVRGDIDPKFHGSPGVAFELGLIGTGIFGAVLIVAFLIGTSAGTLFLRAKTQSSKWLWSFVAGVAAASGLRALYALFRGTGAFASAAWVWIVGFPTAYALLLCARCTRQSDAGDSSRRDRRA